MTWTRPAPCAHLVDGHPCSRPDTRPYLPGWRCPDHTPAALDGRPEPDTKPEEGH